jgi:integrase
VGRGAAGDLAEGGDPEADHAGPAGPFVEFGELALGGGEADAQALGFAQPALLLGFGDAGGQVVADLGQAGPLGWVCAQEGASDAPLTEPTERPSGLLPRSTDSDSATSSCPVRACQSLRVTAWICCGYSASPRYGGSRRYRCQSTTVRNVAGLAVARVGRVEETGDPLLPFRLLDEQGAEVPAVTEFLHHMLADDASPASLRSYAYELLAWFRFLDAVMVAWDLAGRVEARDFALWLKTARKPTRQRRPDAPAPGSVNSVTGKTAPGENYAARTRRHARAVIRSFYEYHREMHGRPLVNPFPQAKGAEEGQLNARHNPMQPFRQPSRRAAYQPKEPRPAPRSIPDQAFNDLFAGLTCNRDRALIAFYISTGARASELLGVSQGLVAPEEQTIGVIRKGSRALQHLPASTDAFVWLRLYQQEMHGLVPKGPGEPLWWTLRRPFAPLTYDAARMVFTRVNRMLGANWTLHDLRHILSA